MRTESFRPSGEIELTTFGLLHHGTVIHHARRVTAAISEHYRGERRLIAREPNGRYCSVVLERAHITLSQRPVGLADWVACSDGGQGRGGRYA